MLIDSYPKTELCDYSPSSGFAFSSICSLIAVYIEQIRFSHDVSSIDLNAAEICTCINFIEKLLYAPFVTESRFHWFCIDQLNLLTDRCLDLGEELQETHCFDGGAEKCVLLIEEGDYELNDVRGHNECKSMIRHVENNIIQSVSLGLDTMKTMGAEMVDPTLFIISQELVHLKSDAKKMSFKNSKSKRNSKCKDPNPSGLKKYSFLNQVKKVISFRRSYL